MIYIDDLKNENQSLKQSKFGNVGESEDNSEQNLELKLKKAQDDLEYLKYRMDEKEKEIAGMRSEKFQLKKKIRDVEEKANKYENNYIPKLKETKNFQKEIYHELERIRNDAELLPWMFRAEAVQRKKYKHDKDEAVAKMTKY